MQKAEIYELRERIKAMERKVEIAKGNKKLPREEDSMGSMPEQGCRPARWTPGMLKNTTHGRKIMLCARDAPNTHTNLK